ncbi:DUF2490 domain-containing protein [Pseudoprevotella muciniphila]|uniref:DUF2490 domain-containing protein n=1 Tax=Pseudoprevotella muciniphila TaxID=2133944 RepID=A0A5P8E8H0_9BACT|nr:DUF2490 domain-containing protein [Pseudoprevotella muciniphila]QFQ13263.1 DUF2490 domain-containing protein [Pseudoprevotella muciniphila]
MKRLLSLVLGAMAVLSASAQSDDFGIWTEVGIEKKFGKKLSLEGGVEARFEDKVTKVTRTGFNIGVTYKPWKFLRFGAGYAFMNDWKDTEVNTKYDTDAETGTTTFSGYNIDKDFRRNKHRLYIQAVGKLDVGRFSFSLRERLQYTHYRSDETNSIKYRTPLDEESKEFYEMMGRSVYTYNNQYFGSKEEVIDNKHSKNRYYVRSRFQVSYNIKGIPLEPYASIELSHCLNKGFGFSTHKSSATEGSSWNPKKYRYTIGADYTIKKTHQFGLAYVYNHGTDDDNEGDLHAINLSYKFKF